MKYTIIAPAGEHLDALYTGVREFPTKRIVLVTTSETKKYARRAAAVLKKFMIPIETREIKGEIMEAMFQAIAEIKDAESNTNLLINASTGSTEVNCAAICAGYVNGLKAFVAEKGAVKLLPIMKFSYYKIISERKLKILKVLATKTCFEGLEKLTAKTKMNLPLLSYHINGTTKSEGLKQLGLVDTSDTNGKVRICLTSLGRLLLRGYIPNGHCKN